jgi:DUF4097 and DUF4098 domain-containing protein YvlB
MRTIYLLVLVLSFSVLLYGSDKMNKEFNVESGQHLEIDLDTGGDIEVIGWDKEVVSITIYTDEDDLEDYDIDIEEFSKGVRVNIDYWRRSNRHSGDMMVRANVPLKFNAELNTMGGDILIKKIEGEFDGQTMGGDLGFVDLKGEMEMSTMGGDIQAENCELDGKVSTMGGEVDFVDIVGDINASTMGGDITFRNVKKSDNRSEGNEVKISTMGGEILVDEAPFGADVSTMGGDIVIKSAGKYIVAQTMGGDIDVRKLDGGIDASTMGGDIDVVMVGDPDEGDREVDLSTKGGEIHLTVPEGLSMEFDLKIEITRRRDDYSIHCDFPIDIEGPNGKDSSWGSSRNYIYGTGKVNGGKYKIRIDTINGDIYIHKGK